ncbi:MAG TPA: hypothetical protein VGB22_07020 [candidate division Zixibacteria bacterium]|jgi:hypothetical protein
MKERNKPLANAPFSYRPLKGNRVQLLYGGRVVVTLSSAEGAKFLTKVAACPPEDAQLLLARATKNFKRGNERQKQN